MKFPSHVPIAVQHYALHCLTFCSRMLDSCDKAPAIVREFFAKHGSLHDFNKQGSTKALDVHLGALVDEWTCRESIRHQRETLNRLLFDERMREAYDSLQPRIVEDEQWHAIVMAATLSNRDFAQYRVTTNHGAALSSEIALVASHLSYLLDCYRNLDVHVPSYWTVGSILYPDTEIGDPPREGWFLWSPEFLDELAARAGKTATEMRARCRDPNEALAWSIHGLAPSGILHRLIIAALRSRQHNVKTAYLRAFCFVLAERGLAADLPNMHKGLAVISTVALNDPEIVVQASDFRLVMMGEESTRASEDRHE